MRYAPTALAAALFLAYLAVFLPSFPRVYVDEPWESIPAYQLATQGVLNDPVLTGRTFNEEHLLAPRLLQAVVLAGAYRLFGLHLLVGRGVSLLFAAAALAVLYRLLRESGCSRWLAGLGVALLCTDNLFFVFARLVRPEILMAFLALAAVWLLHRGLTTGSRAALAGAGIAAGLGAWSHPNFLLVLVALVLILLREFGARAPRAPACRLFTAGLILGLAPYLVYLVYQDAGNHFTHLWAQISDRAPQTQPGFWSTTLSEEMERYRQYLFFPYRAPVVLVQVFFLVLSWPLNDRLSRWSRILVATHLLLFPVLVVSRTARYLVPVVPFLVILIVQVLRDPGSILELLRRRVGQPRRQRMAGLAAVGLLVYQTIGNPVAMAAKRVTGYEQVLTDLRQYIPPHSRVWGSMMFWFGFSDCGYRTQYTFGEDLEGFRPQYLITDDDVIWKKESYFDLEAGRKWPALIERVEGYAASRGRLVAQLPDRGYGPLRVWRVEAAACSSAVTRDGSCPIAADSSRGGRPETGG